MSDLQRMNGANKQVKRRIGRPRRDHPPGARVSLGLRVTTETKKRLDEAAEKSGRSQSQEAELRIEQSFLLEDMLRTRLISMRVPAGKTGGREE